jgi:DNA-binding NarL/FixJ family response regulator
MAGGKDGGQLPRAREATAKRPIKVLICDASSVVRRGLTQMLTSDEGIVVVAETQNAEGLLSAVKEAGASVVIGDPHQLGPAAIATLVAATIRVLIVSFTIDEQHLVQSIAAGCSGYVDQRELGPGDLARMVRLGASRHGVLSETATDGLNRYLRQNAAVLNGEFGASIGPVLSKREKQVLELVARGRSNAAISQALGLHVSTVKTHLLHVYEKLGVRNRLDLISLAMERGWVKERRHPKP